MNSINPNDVFPDGLPKTEDLIIYANLSVNKKTRSILFGDDNSRGNNNTLNISFFNFDKSSGYQTTNWTNEISSNGRNLNGETFGMTDIQIKFDKNNIPTVTINFVDIRGTSLLSQGDDSPYSALFSFPYPEFLLTVKGYYGKAVKYPLHLLDFSSRFNSQTGNFEITCQFIGFTYAKLTDIPIVYALFAKELNGSKERLVEGKPLPYLVDFIKNIETLSIQIDTLSQSKESQEFGEIVEKKRLITRFYEDYNESDFWTKQENTSIFYVKDQFFRDIEFFKTKGINFDYTRDTFAFPKSGGGITPTIYTEKDKLPPYSDYSKLRVRPITNSLKQKITDEGLEKFIKEQQQKVLGSLKKLLGEENDTSTTTINGYINKEKQKFATQINDLSKEILGEKPTVKYVMDIILTDCEIFLKKLYDLGKSIEKDEIQTERKSFFPTSFGSDLVDNNKTIFPFPAYYILDDSEYRHEWIGKIPSVTQSSFPEITFVDNFIEFNQKILNSFRQETIISPESGWFPINPLESVYYFDGETPVSPYYGITDINDLLDKLIDRYIIILSSFNIKEEFNKETELIFNNLSILELNNLLLSFPIDSNQYEKLLKSLNSGLINQIKKRIKTRIDNGNLIIKTFNSPTNIDMVTSSKEVVVLKGSNNNILNTLNSDIVIKIFDFENNIINNNISNNIVNELNNFNSLIPKWLKILDFSKDEYEIDGKSNLIRFKLNYENYISQSGSDLIILGGFVRSFLFDTNPLKLKTNNKIFNYFYFPYKENITGLELPTNMTESLQRWQLVENNYINDVDISKFTFLNYIYKLNWIELKKILTNIVGVIEIPYFTILQIGAILWDEFSIQKNILILLEESFRGDQFRFPFDHYEDVQKSFEDFPLNKQIFINEFLNFDFNKIYDEIVLTKEKDEIDLTKDTINLYNFLESKKIIINPSYRIWNKKDDVVIDLYRSNTSNRIEIFQPGMGILKDKNFEFLNVYSGGLPYAGDSFFKTMQKELKKIISENEKTDKGTTNYLQEALNVSNDIKLETYNSIKGLYDRWIGGNTEKSATDLKSSFVYIDRFYKDIGEKLVINPKMLLNVRENLKMPLYSVISTLLSENRMDFHPLPSFITSFNEIEKLSTDLFNTFTIIDNTTTSEPKFICMYVGGTSKALNEINGNFKSDTPEINNIKDYSSTINPKIGFLPFSFDVNFGSQYQSHFKEIDFDQKQFKVTNESLQIEDEIARSANTRKGIVLGQSLYNVYLQRSYTIRVTGLGNMMIQPLLYFKMNNIPFLKGYYLIINVEHSVKPNYVETIFTGVRISEATIPIVKEYAQFFNLDSYAETSGEIFQVNEGWEKQLKSLGV